VNGELERIWKKAVVHYCKVLSLNFKEGTDKPSIITDGVQTKFDAYCWEFLSCYRDAISHTLLSELLNRVLYVTAIISSGLTIRTSKVLTHFSCISYSVKFGNISDLSLIFSTFSKFLEN
jgi:hypothetical protein